MFEIVNFGSWPFSNADHAFTFTLILKFISEKMAHSLNINMERKKFNIDSITSLQFGKLLNTSTSKMFALNHSKQRQDNKF